MKTTSENRYTLHEVIGTGSAGTVYRAIDNVENTTVAIKKLRVGIDASETDPVIRFKHESEIISRLKHPHIVKLVSLEEIDDNLCIIMEFFKGKSLKESLHDFTLREKIEIMRQCASGLHYIHEQGIIHRDIKPGNILADKTPVIKIIDFGIAYLTEFFADSNRNTLVGSFAYISPEQTGILRRTIDNRSDLYSLGATFYELLTGTLPFNDNDPGVLIHKHLSQQPEPPSSINREIPPVIDDIIMKLLAKEPEDRYFTAHSLAKDLEYYLKNPETDNFAIATSDTTTTPNYQVKLTGRDKEIKLLQSAQKKTANNQSHISIIRGKSGSGKSKLVETFKRKVIDVDTVFFEYKCTPAIQNVPFSPLIEIMEQFFSSIYNDSFKQRILNKTSDKISYLKEVFPAFRKFFSTHKTGTEPASGKKGQNELMQAIHDFFFAISSLGKTITCFIDDIQWADNKTLEFVEYLAHNTIQGKLHIIISGREEDQVDSLLSNLSSTASTSQVIPVAPFTREIIPLFINRILGQNVSLPHSFYQLMFESSLGYPYILLENIKSLYDNDLLWNRDGTWQIDENKISEFTFEKDISEVLLKRLSLLPQENLDVLSSASVFGKEFSFDLLKKLVSKTNQQIKPGRIIEILDSAIREQLLNENTAKGTGFYSFVHDKVTETLYNRVKKEDITKLHSECAALLENNEPGTLENSIFHITYHYNKTDNREKIIQYNTNAYQEAIANYSYKDAIHYLKLLVDLYIQEDHYSREMVNLVIELLRYMNVAARYDESFQYVETVLAKTEKNNWEHELHKLYLEKGLAHYYKNDMQNAIECFTEAFTIAEKLGEEIQLPEPYLQFGGAYFFTSEFKKSEYNYNQALKYLDDSQLDNMLLAYAYRSVTLVARGLYNFASQDVRIIENEIHKITEPLTLIQLNHLISVYYSWSLRDLPRAMHYAEKNLDLADKIGNIVYTYSALSDIQHVYFYTKQYELVLDIFTKIIKIADDTGTTIGIHYCWLYKAEAHLYLNQFDEANTIAERFLKEKDEITNLHAIISFLKCRAIYLYLHNKTNEALNVLSEAQEIFQKEDISAWGVFILTFKEYILSKSNDIEKCTKARNELNKLLTNKELAPHHRHARELIKIIELQQDKAAAQKPDTSHDKSTVSSIKEKIQLDNIIKTSQLISSILDINTLLKEIMKRILEVTGGERGALLLYSEETEKFEYKITSNIDIKKDDFKVSQRVIEKVLETQKGIVVTNVGNEPFYESSDTIINQNIKSMICSPLLLQEKMIGLLYLDSKLLNNLFVEEDLELLSVFASQAAIAIDNARLHAQTLERVRIDQEMEIAKDIQLSIIPVVQDTDNYEIAAYMKTATEVGGDYYDLFMEEEPYFGVFGDASGHGLKSGLVMMMAEVAFNSYMMSRHTRLAPLQELYQNINATLFKNIQERLSKRSAKGHQYGYMYMTLRLFKFDRDGNFEFFGNDHAEPFICRSGSNDIEIIPSSGFLVGIMEDAARADKSYTFSLESGDMVVLYSDGITESIRETLSDDLDKVMFGEKRLYSIVQKNKEKKPAEIIDTLIKEVEQWMTEQVDDISIVIIKKK